MMSGMSVAQRRDVPLVGAIPELRLIGRVACFACVVLLPPLGALAVLYVVLAGATPGWWAERSVEDIDAALLAERVENGVATELHRGRVQEAEWTVAISDEQANAWLAQGLPRWLRNRELEWADRAPDVRASFEDGRIRVGARNGPGSRVISAAFQLRVDESGALWAQPSQLAAGSLRLPESWARARAREAIDRYAQDDSDRIGEAIEGRAPIIDRALIDLGDGRRVRVVEIESEPGRLLVTCVTERPRDGATSRR